MESVFLQQLLTKPIPKTQQGVEIILPQIGEVALQTKIIDKTSLGYDGEALRRRLQRFEKVRRETPLETEEEEEEDALESAAAATVESAAKTVKDVETAAAAETVEAVVSRPPKKLSQKIKIGRSSHAISAIPVEEETSPPDLSLIVNARGKTIADRLPPPSEKILIRAPAYYLNNQKKFISFITNLFLPYRRQLLEEEKKISCDQREGKFTLLTHQKIVRDYLNLYTPYRGLLLYHGLGTGKTCSSIAIAEGLKNTRPIIIMTPASLRMNYIQELKKCGDILYKINQFWEFISTEGNEPLAKALSKVLALPLSFIVKQKGAWFINLKRKPNYEKLNTAHRQSVDHQVDLMIARKYFFINYNGLRNSHLAELKQKLPQPNLFDNSVVIIDEVHNFVSRIVNKLKNKKSLSMQLYNFLQKAENCRIICLTGTPIINYPNELGILFNILRGNITTYTLPLTINTQRKVNEVTMKKILKDIKTLDYIRYQASLKQLIITRNPFGFINMPDTDAKDLKTLGGEEGDISNKNFIKRIISALKENNIAVDARRIKVRRDTALPDTLEGFRQWFIHPKTGELKNQNIFKKRILGLTSHFRSPQEQLMARFDKKTDLHIEEIEMSDYQLNLYENAREGERKLEMEQAKRRGRRRQQQQGNVENIYGDSVSTYRIFSRAFCNFVFPGNIPRPLPQGDEDVKTAAQANIDEDILDNATAEQKIQNADGRYTPDDAEQLQSQIQKQVDNNYESRIKTALEELKKQQGKYLTKSSLVNLSPKFLTILNNIENLTGLHLVYSQFRTLEGIGIFKLVLEANGFAQFKIIKKRGTWHIVQKKSDIGKPKFILYTGTESAEEKEIVRNIFNSTWTRIPRSIQKQLQSLGPNNHHGEIAKVFMITAAGAEGISLRNVRYVHIMEPYWHPVRIEQVIGRARRICSHNDLPPDERRIEVYLYLMRFSQHQIIELISSELKIKDVSKRDGQTPLTTDQALYEISSIKEKINNQLLTAVKEAAIDCALQMRKGGENLTCFAFAKPKAGQYAYKPSLTGGDDDDIEQANKIKKKVKVRKINFGGKKYILNMETNEVYDLISYEITKTQEDAVPIVVGDVVTDPNTKKKIIRFR